MQVAKVATWAASSDAGSVYDTALAPAIAASVNGTSTSWSSSSTTTATSSSSQADRLKLALLERIAGLNRGALATASDKQAIDQLLRSLEAAGNSPQPFAGSPAAIEGRWELLYTNTEAFRSSPFFLAFEGLVQNKQIAEAIFAFTDAIPGAEIRCAYQTISLLSGKLISEVDMYVFPGFKGTVVTTSRASALPPSALSLNIESTRVVNSNFSPFLDNVMVPVEQVLGQIAGNSSITETSYEITYLDDHLRITRAGDQVLLHRKVL